VKRVILRVTAFPVDKIAEKAVCRSFDNVALYFDDYTIKVKQNIVKNREKSKLYIDGIS